MREAADAYQTPKHGRTNGTDPSLFGASEQAMREALARHRDLLQRMRESEIPEEPDSSTAKIQIENVPGVQLVTDEDRDCAAMGPVDFAKYVCDKGTLTAEQRGPVALVARDMQVVYDAEVTRRATLTES